VENDTAGIIGLAECSPPHLFDSVSLKKRGYQMWRMTWRALCPRPNLRCQRRVLDHPAVDVEFAGGIRQRLAHHVGAEVEIESKR